MLEINNSDERTDLNNQPDTQISKQQSQEHDHNNNIKNYPIIKKIKPNSNPDLLKDSTSNQSNSNPNLLKDSTSNQIEYKMQILPKTKEFILNFLYQLINEVYINENYYQIWHYMM